MIRTVTQPAPVAMSRTRRVLSTGIATALIAAGGFILWNYWTSDGADYAIKQLTIAVFLIAGGAAIIYSDLTDSD